MTLQQAAAVAEFEADNEAVKAWCCLHNTRLDELETPLESGGKTLQCHFCWITSTPLDATDVGLANP